MAETPEERSLIGSLDQRIMSDEEDGELLVVRSPKWRSRQLNSLISTLDGRVGDEPGSTPVARQRKWEAESPSSSPKPAKLSTAQKWAVSDASASTVEVGRCPAVVAGASGKENTPVRGATRLPVPRRIVLARPDRPCVGMTAWLLSSFHCNRSVFPMLA